MKKRDIINKLKELDNIPLPEKEAMIQKCQEINTISSERKEIKRHIPHKRKITILAIAASLLIVSGITVSASEAAEYGKAIDFFNEYDLSYKGLSRSEVKKVYRDITTESFSYGKTAQVLTQGIEGYEIKPSEMSSDDLSRLWLVGYDIKSSNASTESNGEYEYYYVNIVSENEDNDITYNYDKLTKKKNGKIIWNKKLYNFYTEAICPAGNRILVAGDPSSDGGAFSGSMIGVYLINDDSSVEWYCEYDSKITQDNTQIDINYIMYKGESFVLFSVSRDDLWITEIDMNGKVICEEHLRYDSRGARITRAVEVDDSYLILRENSVSQIQNGKVSESVQYFSDGEKYVINDMIEYNGIIYLSGTLISTENTNDAGLLQKYNSKFGSYEATDSELLEFFRENHKAVVMVCDPSDSRAVKFYSLSGAAGSSLEIVNGSLKWNVNRHTTAKRLNGDISTYYIATGCFAELGSDVWSYIFDPYGQLCAEKDTGEKIVTEG